MSGEPGAAGPGAPWPPEFEAVVGAHLVVAPPPGTLDPDLRLEDEGLDSVTVIGLMVELEERFAFTFSDELLTMDTFATPRVLWDAITAVRGTADPPVNVG